MLDGVVVIAEVVLEGDIERTDDEAQAIVFWSWHAVLFEFGQERWYMEPEGKMSQFIDFMIRIISGMYPVIEPFMSYNDFQIMKHSLGVILTMSVRLFNRGLVRKIWHLIFHGESVDLLHAAVLTALFFLEYPNLLARDGVPDIAKVTNFVQLEYKVEREDDFLGLLAAVSEKLPERQQPPPPLAFRCSLFVPLQF
jgi:hypothetical protein